MICPKSRFEDGFWFCIDRPMVKIADKIAFSRLCEIVCGKDGSVRDIVKQQHMMIASQSNSQTNYTGSANMLQVFNGWCQLCSKVYKECDSYDYTRNRRKWCFCGKNDKEILEICPESKFENLIRIVKRFEENK